MTSNVGAQLLQRQTSMGFAAAAASFNDSEATNRAARDGVGVGLGRLTRARLLLDSGQLVALSDRPIRAGYAHYLVHPARSADHAGLRRFRDWLLPLAREHGEAIAQPLR